MIRSLISMKVAAVLTLTITGCVAPAELIGYPKARARSSIARIDAAYDLVRGPAEQSAARLPEPTAQRALMLLAVADAALGIVNSDAPMIDRVRAAEDLVRAVRVLRAIGR